MAADQDLNTEALVEEGLKLYSQGDLDEALAKWRSVLARVPEHHRAREYLKYVEDNRAALEESFQLARSQTPTGRSSDAGSAPAAESALAPGRALAAVARKPATVDRDADTERLRTESDEIEESSLERFPAAEELRAPEDPLDRAVREMLSTASAGVPTDHEETLRGLKTPTARGSGPVPAGAPAAASAQAGLAAARAAAPGRSAGASPVFRSAPSDEPSFSTLAAEVAGSASLDDSNEDHTPRIDLDQLQPRLAATRRTPSRHMPKVEQGSEPELEAAAPRSAAPAALAPAAGGQAAPPARTPPPAPSAGPEPSAELKDLLSELPGFGARRAQKREEGRRGAPLSLVDGGGEPKRDFQPDECTPVALQVPRPALVPADKSGPSQPEVIEPTGDAGAAAELSRARDITPASLFKRGRAKPLRPSGAPLAKQPEGPASTHPGMGGEAATRRRSEGSGARDSREWDRGKSQSGKTPLPTKEGSEEKLESMLEGARQLHEQGTFEGSLWLCERVLAIDPECAPAKELQEKNRQILVGTYQQLLGDMTQVPVVQIPHHEIVWHKLDHRAGFLLSRIDGQLTFEDLLDVSGMSEFEAYHILSQLLQQGVIGPRR